MSEKGVFRLVLFISVLVFLLVVLLNERIFPVPDSFPIFIYKLPLVNACINATVAILLLFSLGAIRQKKINRHKATNLSAFGLSALFLISYVTYHYFVGHTVFGGEGAIETFYKIVLWTHIPLAAIVLPLILISFYYGLTNKIVQHKKLVRFTYPIWLYVAITGVLVYILISPYYPY